MIRLLPVLCVLLFGFCFFKYREYAKRNLNRASYYMSLVIIALWSLFLYFTLVVTGLFSPLLAAFIDLGSIGFIFVIRYIVIYLSKFVKVVNRI